MFVILENFQEKKVLILLGVRLIGKSEFRFSKSKSGFHLREIRPQGRFQLRNPNPDFMDFLFTVRLGNPKKDLQNYSREQWSSFC